jgi:type I restriction enzyme S subunit
MKTAVIRSSWMEGYGYRLDCSPYLSGALETKILLEKLPLRKDTLKEVTTGIYHAGRESRQWVESSEFGVPFISGSDLQKADLSDLPLISKRQVAKTPHFIIRAGYTLITRSGTIGKMAYARRDMDGMACSEHVLRVVPDTEKIPSGYLYAYLSSKFGVPLVVSGTYGSIIQGIEPEHLLRDDVVVPRLRDALEQEIHRLVEEAAELRSRANDLLQATLVEFEREAGLQQTVELRRATPPLFVEVSSAKLFGRLDTKFHGPRHYSVQRTFDHQKVKAISVGQLALGVFEPMRFKRIEHDNPEHSVPLFGTGNIGDVDPEPIARIMAFPGCEDYAVGALAVLIPRSGQLNGIIGTAVLPIGGVRTGVVSEHAIRIRCRNEAETGYIFLALWSETGRAQLKSRAFGGSIPTLDVTNISSVLVPELTETKRERFGMAAFQVAKLRTKAIETERLAREKLVNAIERNCRM